MADDEAIERVMRLVRQKTAEYRANPPNLTLEPEPAETIAEMYRDLETLDNNNLLFMVEDSPTCREILLRHMLGLTSVSAAMERRR